MARFIPDISRDEFSSNIEDLTPMGYEETYEDLEETEIDSEFRNIANAFYKFNKDAGWDVDRNTLSTHNAKIVRNTDTKHIYVDYNGEKIRITDKKIKHKFLSLGTIQKNAGVYFVRNVLGFGNYVSGGIPPPVEARVRNRK